MNKKITWDEINSKYPTGRSHLNEKKETEFVNDCFNAYENEGFANKFWSPYTDHKQRIGQKFKVIGRCSTDDCDLSCLPMWNIKFSDNSVITAYPEEIIPSEMKSNGCKESM